MKRILPIAFLLMLFLAGNALAGAFDFASTTGERYRNIVVIGPLFDTDNADSAEADTSNWFKIADYQIATFYYDICCSNATSDGMAGTDTIASYQVIIQMTPLKDSAYAISAIIDTVSSGGTPTKTLVTASLANYAFPFARIVATRIDTFAVATTIKKCYGGLKRDDVFHIPVHPADALREHLEYDTDDGK